MEENKHLELTFSDLFAVFKRCWIIMAVVGLLVTVLSYVVMVNSHVDKYTATVGMWAYRTGSEDGSTGNVQQNYYATIMSTQNIDEFMEIAQSGIVLEKVIADQNLTINQKELAKMLSVSQKRNDNTSTIFYLSVTAATPESAQRLGEAWGRVTSEYINGLVQKEVVLIFDPAPLPDQPSNPFSILKVLLLAVVGAVIVYGVFFVRFLMDDKINTAEDVDKYLGLHVLGAIPDKNQVMRRRSKSVYYGRSDAPKLN